MLIHWVLSIRYLNPGLNIHVDEDNSIALKAQQLFAAHLWHFTWPRFILVHRFSIRSNKATSDRQICNVNPDSHPSINVMNCHQNNVKEHGYKTSLNPDRRKTRKYEFITYCSFHVNLSNFLSPKHSVNGIWNSTCVRCCWWNIMP